MNPNYRGMYLELMKISKQNGTMDKMKRVYLMNLVRAYKREKAAAATATRDQKFLN